MKRILLVFLGVAMAVTVVYAQSQVLSRNAVGYVRVDMLRGNYALVRLDFENISGANGGCLAVSNVLNDVPTNTLVYLWDYVNQTYKSPIQKSARGTWGSGGSNLICRGDAVFVKIAGDVASNSNPVYIMGEVPDRFTAPTTEVFNLKAGMNMVGYAYPLELPFLSTALSSNIPNSSLLYVFNPVITNYDTPYQKSARGAWDAVTTNLIMRPGMGVWVRTTQLWNYVEGKPYTWP